MSEGRHTSRSPAYLTKINAIITRIVDERVNTAVDAAIAVLIQALEPAHQEKPRKRKVCTLEERVEEPRVKPARKQRPTTETSPAVVPLPIVLPAPVAPEPLTMQLPEYLLRHHSYLFRCIAQHQHQHCAQAYARHMANGFANGIDIADEKTVHDVEIHVRKFIATLRVPKDRPTTLYECTLPLVAAMTPYSGDRLDQWTITLCQRAQKRYGITPWIKGTGADALIPSANINLVQECMRRCVKDSQTPVRIPESYTNNGLI